GGGGGGGSGSRGGGGGGSGAMHFSPGGSGSAHFSQGSNPAHSRTFTGNNFSQHSRSGPQGNSNHSGNPNWGHGSNLNKFNSQHSQNFQSWHHPGGYASWGHHGWDHSFHNYYWGPGWNASWYWGFPFGFAYWGGYPFGWGGYWADYYCPYGTVYANSCPTAAYSYSYADDGQYAVNHAPNQPVATDDSQSAGNDGEATANEGLQYYNEARAVFTRGDYRNALRLAGHSGVESPQNAKVHELTSLALFASGEYRAAATEAHVALALSPPSDWNNLYAYYNDADKYTEHLRTLEKNVADVPKSAPGHFLLGYHYLMTGATEEAKDHFAQAAKLTPNDKLAQHILKQLEAGSAVTAPDLPKQPSEPKGKQL
ncbi:MAG: tetratricopeptide repeat protein, partial [Planctomycetota bacterium]